MFYFLRKIVAVVIVALMGFGGYSLYNEFGRVEKPLPAVFVSDLLDIQEMAAVQYNYNTYIKYEKERPKIPWTDWDIPGTKSEAAFNVVGNIKVGVDMNNANIKQLGNQVVVILPAAKVLSHELDLSKCQVVYENTSIFNLPEANDYLAFIGANKEKIAKSELTDAIFATAQERAKQIITNYIHNLDSRINVTFVG